MRICALSLLLALISADAAFAHVDHIVSLAADGTLGGLPKEFQPATVHFEWTEEPSDRHMRSLALTIGTHRVALPECVVAPIQTQRLEDIKASGSWYHDESVLPYYLNIRFFDP